MYVRLLDLQVILFFIYLIVESFEKVFMYYLIVGCLIIYHITIISNALNKIANCVKFRVIETW